MPLKQSHYWDNISNIILKLAAPIIYHHLFDLFNLSILINVFPAEWKVAKVTIARIE